MDAAKAVAQRQIVAWAEEAEAMSGDIYVVVNALKVARVSSHRLRAMQITVALDKLRRARAALDALLASVESSR